MSNQPDTQSSSEHFCDDGCDISECEDCGEEFTDPCPRHRAAGHVPSYDPYGDGVDCHQCCRVCGAQA